jgi:hypothetical protein
MGGKRLGNSWEIETTASIFFKLFFSRVSIHFKRFYKVLSFDVEYFAYNVTFKSGNI